MIKTFIFSLSLLTTSSLWAQDSSSRSHVPHVPEYRINVQDPVGFVPTVGFSTGYMTPNETHQTEGVPTQIKLLGSYYFDTKDWIADFGLGFSRVGFSQTSRAESVVLTGLIEGGARYQFEDRWQIGGVVSSLVGQSERFGSVSRDFTTFVGPQITKEWDYNNTYLFRFGARLMTDLSISGSSVNMALLTLDIGIDPGAYTSYVVHDEPQTPVVSAPVSTSPLAGGDKTLDQERGLHFETGTVVFDRLSKKNMDKVARLLSDNAALYERVEVVGHADRRGSSPINLQLSERRAHTVARVLAHAGVPQKKIQQNWKGASQPIASGSNAHALRLNRRVELRLHGVKDKEKLNHILTTIR